MYFRKADSCGVFLDSGFTVDLKDFEGNHEKILTWRLTVNIEILILLNIYVTAR